MNKIQLSYIVSGDYPNGNSVSLESSTLPTFEAENVNFAIAHLESILYRSVLTVVRTLGVASNEKFDDYSLTIMVNINNGKDSKIKIMSLTRDFEIEG